MRIQRLARVALGSCAFVLACSGTSSSGGEGGASTSANGGATNGAAGASTSANGGVTNGAGGASGGTNDARGGSASGGASSGGKQSSNGGSPGLGGSATSGGTSTGGKSSANGGTSAGGKASASGGASSGGKSSANGGGGGAGSTTCKRGIAANTAPGAAFSGAITWWYNWAMTGSGAGNGIEFTPMAWGSASVKTALPNGAKYLLGFNEPNFHAQSNLTAQQAAELWPTLESKAKAAGIPLVSPAMNYCGPATECNGTDPYQYLKDFFAACTNCEVDYVAVHWYNCDLPSLKDYLEPGGNLPGFEQFGKPIWLTEFSCDGKASVAEQEAYMRAAIPYLEQSSKVFRYSWFSADPIPNAKLMDSSGSPTALGRVYMDLPESCR